MNGERNIHTLGIVLKKQPSGENDLQITIYSPEIGKFRAIAKGARNIKSATGSHLEPLNFCQIQLYKTSHRYTITQCQVNKNYKIIKTDFRKSMAATMLLEIFQKSTYSDESSKELFDLLLQTLDELEQSSQAFLIIESFKLKLLQFLGALPDLSFCGTCRVRWDKDHNIWINNVGHLHCQKCKINEAKSQPIEFNTMKLLNYLVNSLEKKRILLEEINKKQLKMITNFFLQHYISNEIISEKILKQLQEI